MFRHQVNSALLQPWALVTPAVDCDSLPTRSSLLKRLRDMDDHVSWRSFFESYWRLIYNVARKSGLSDSEAQDVVQDTVIAVARKMPDFRYDPAKGSFKSWLLLITRRRIQDHLRKLYRSVRITEPYDREAASYPDTLPANTPAPDAQIDAAWEDEWQQTVMQAALARVRRQANPKHYQVFDCCVLHNLPVAEVGKMLGLNAAQVYLAKHRITLSIKRAAREIERSLNRQALMPGFRP
jgi:RNA polymerase sigma-70 factor (ECF subfamily)